MEIKLPTEIEEPTRVNPKTMLIYAIPKAGKTTVLAQLPDSLLIELEPGGADYVAARKFVIDGVDPVQNILTLKALGEKLKKERPYKRVIIDTLTKIDEWSEIAGTYRYMKTPQGKRFNAGVSNINDTDWQSVQTLPDGNGYRYSRDWFTDLYDDMLNWADEIIFVCHVKDKYIGSKTGEAVQSIDINLTGKLSKVIPARVDVIGYFYRKGTDAYINFDGTTDKVCGGRPPHLTGEILISQKMDDGTIETFWNQIYKDNV